MFQKVREELEGLRKGQEQTIKMGEKKEMKVNRSEFITAMEFMEALQIRRWKFNQLISDNLIRTIKKARKIYVPVSEVERYFREPRIR